MAPLVNLITVKLLSPRHDRNRIDGRHQFSQYATGVNRARVRISYIKWVGRDYALICADFHRFYGTKGRPVDPSLVIFTFHDAGGAVERCHISLVTGWKCKWRERGFRLKILPAKKSQILLPISEIPCGLPLALPFAGNKGNPWINSSQSFCYFCFLYLTLVFYLFRRRKIVNIWKFFSREGSSKFRLLFGNRLRRDFLFNWVKEIFGELLLDLGVLRWIEFLTKIKSKYLKFIFEELF